MALTKAVSVSDLPALLKEADFNKELLEHAMVDVAESRIAADPEIDIERLTLSYEEVVKVIKKLKKLPQYKDAA